MTIPNTFVSGVNTNFTSELNENFEYCNMEIYARGIVASTTTSSVLTALATVNLPANTFSRLLNIRVGFEAQANCGSASGAYGTVSLSVNGSTIISAHASADDADPVKDWVAGSWSIPFRAITDINLTSSIPIIVYGQGFKIKGTYFAIPSTCKYLVVEGI